MLTGSRYFSYFISIAVGSIVFVVYWYLIHGIPVLTEARDFIAYNRWVENASFREFFIFPVGMNRRLLSMYAFSLERQICGFNADYINFIQLLLIGLCATIITIHGNQLTRSISLSCIGAMLWAFSLSVGNAAIWQATQHDKLALITMFLVFIWGYRTVTKGFLFNFLANSFIGIFLCSLALNSKEISFVIPPVLILQAILFFPKNKEKSFLRSTIAIAPAILYCIWYIVNYLLVFNSSWQKHVAGGSVCKALIVYSKFLANLGNVMSLSNDTAWSSTIKYIVIACLAIIFMFYMFILIRHMPIANKKLKKNSSKNSANIFHVVLYLLAIMFLCIGTVAKASYPSAYYLLIPTWCFWFALLIGIWFFTKETFNSKYFHVILAVSIILISQLGFWGNWLEGSAFRRVVNQGRNLSSGYAVIRKVINPSKIKLIRFAVCSSVNDYWYFFRDWDNNDIAIGQCVVPFIFEKKIEIPLVYQLGSYIGANTIGEIIATWSNDLALISLQRYKDNHIIKDVAIK